MATKRKSDNAGGTTPVIQHAVVPLDALAPHPRNYRQHPQQQLDRLAASLARFGQVRSIVVQEGAPGRYLMVAGHGLAEAARAQGYRELRADVIPATWTPEQVEGYLIADNQHANGAQDDMVALAELLEAQYAADYDLASVGSSREELDALLAELDATKDEDERRDVDDPDGGGDDFDTTPDEEGPTRCQSGDLWQLGEHRLLCGDSTKREDVARLMDGETAQMVWSDPPYGISIVSTDGKVGHAVGTPFGGVKAQRLGAAYGSKPFGHVCAGNVVPTTPYMPVIGDDSTTTAHASYQLVNEIAPKSAQVWWGANYYADVLPPSSGWIVWDKRSNGDTVMTSNNFADCELAWVSSGGPARIFRHIWNGMIRSSEHEKRVHPTQKPVMLAAWAFDKYGSADDIILDPFCGSGMSVIAAERTERKVFALEMSPAYCDVILRRWEAETGREATLLDRVSAADEVSA